MEIIAYGLKCDFCDFIDESIPVSIETLDLPCPKCGESLLTKEDFDLAIQLLSQGYTPVDMNARKEIGYTYVTFHGKGLENAEIVFVEKEN